MDDCEVSAMVSRPARGPAMWAAVGVLGGAALVGLAWAVWPSSAPAARSDPKPVPAVAPAAPPTIIVNVPPPVVPVVTEVGAEPSAAGPPAPVNTVQVPVADKPAPAEESAPQAKPLTTKINLNTATVEELDLLPGVGKATALAIIEYRTKHGKFRTVSELDKVSGIGPSKLEKLRPLVTVD